MAGILLIAGDDHFSRQVFRHERRGYWSGALPLVLEKRGYLGVEVAGPERLGDRQIWSSFDVVLVARLPPGAWTPAAVEAAQEGRAGVLVEGPLPPALRSVLGVRVEGELDPEGSVIVSDEGLTRAGAEFGTPPGGRLSAGKGRPVPRESALDWTECPEIPIDDEQAVAWRREGWDVEAWAPRPEGELLARWRSAADDERYPAVVRQGRLVGCCFGLFAYLSQAHTSAPFEGQEFRSWPSTAATESLLFGLIDLLHAAAGAPRARLLEWPEGMRWVLSVRHDFDRPLTTAQVREVLERHAAVRTAATWYWRARHLERHAGPRDRVRRVARRLRRRAPVGPATSAVDGARAARTVALRPTHEVALHTEQLWRGSERERGMVERAIGQAVRGTSAHGDPACFRYQGAPNVIWADRQGLEYTELIHHSHRHPHRFATLLADGRVRALDVLCLPHHESFDRSTTPGDAAMDSVRAAAARYDEVRGMMQVLNHPDLNQDELFDVLRELPRPGRIDWTAREAADWWRRTHVAGELIVEPGENGTLRVVSKRGVHGAVLELREANGTIRRHGLYLEPGEATMVNGKGSASGADTPRAAPAGHRSEGGVAGAHRRWGETANVFAEALRSYHSNAGHDLDSPAVKSAIRTNSELVPGRGDKLLELLATTTGLESLQDSVVLEVGSGFGSLAAYLAIREPPQRLIAVDNRAEWLDIARRAAAQARIPGIDWVEADMRALSDVVDEPVDLIIANNAFIYLRDKHAMLAALEQFRRVLAPAGHVFLYHANRWTLRDPFTRSPLVHLLPPRVAGGVSRVTGWEHSHKRLRLLSASTLRRYLRRSGFEGIRISGAAPKRRPRWARARFGRYYAIAGRLPPDPGP